MHIATGATAAELRAMLADVSLDPDIRTRVEALLWVYNEVQSRNHGFTGSDMPGEQDGPQAQQDGPGFAIPADVMIATPMGANEHGPMARQYDRGVSRFHLL